MNNLDHKVSQSRCFFLKRSKTVSRFISNDGTENQSLEGISFGTLALEYFQVHGRGLHSQDFWAFFFNLSGFIRMSLSVLYQFMQKRCQHQYGMILPDTVRVGNDVELRQNTTLGIAREDQPKDRLVLENRVNVGINAVVIRGILAGATVGGVPACIVSQKVYNA